MSEIPLLIHEPPIEGSWYEQINKNMNASKRVIDKMSLAQIVSMYRERKFVCDDCGKTLDIGVFKPNERTFENHIIHLINPLFYWSCEDCHQSDIRNGRIIAVSEGNDER